MDEKQKDEYSAQLESVIAMLPGSVYWKSKDGKYLGCNDTAVKILNLTSRNDIIGKTTQDLVGTKLAEELLANDTQVITGGIESYVEEVGPSGNGNLAIYLTKKAPLRNAAGEIIGLVGVSFDITERKQMEEELKILKANAESLANVTSTYLDNILANLPENIYWMNEEGKILGCSKKQATTFGFKDSTELMGKNIYDVGKLLNWPDKVAEEIRAHDLHVMRTQETIQKEEEVILNGEKRIYLAYKNPLLDKTGKSVGVFGVAIDITDRKKIEKELIEAKERAETANQAKSEFLAMVSHELRIPLTGILGMAQLMQSEAELPPTLLEETEDIIKSGEHLLALVDDLLDISKLEARKTELNLSSVNFKKVIEEIVTMTAHKAKQQHLELLVNFEENIPQHVVGDVRALRQIFLNVVGNAIKFTKQGYVLIKVACKEQTDTHAVLQCCITDNGIGIPANKLETIFERFSQGDNSITRKYGGTGLGLAITKSYLELMGGEIAVKSEVGKGTTFTLTIPFELQNVTTLTSPWEKYKSKISILIVDDTLRGEVLKKHIGSSLCEVVPGAQALNALFAATQIKQPFDIVIIDQQLSTTIPMELANHIRTRFKKLPMLALLVTENSHATQNLIKSNGFFTYLTKPTQPTELLTNLTAAWEQWSERIIANITENNQNYKAKVLLVEDDSIVAKVHIAMLEKMGCNVERAETGEQAIVLAKKHFDIIFMDIGLPDISGYDATQQIHNNQKIENKILTPIIGLTGYGHQEYKTKCLNAGMNDVALKPIKIEHLKQLISKYMTL